MKVLEVPSRDVAPWGLDHPDESEVPQKQNVLYLLAGKGNGERSSPARRERQLVPAGPPASSLAVQFNELADTWERETRAESFAHRRAMHPAYQRIIGLGPAVIPLILDRIRQRQSGHWFWALNALTGEDPAAGTTKPRDARAAWLAWGAERGYVAGSP